MPAVEPDDRGLIVSCPQCGQRNRLAYEKLGRAARCQNCRGELRLPGEPIALETDIQFDALTARSALPRHTVLLCCRHRLISPEVDPDYGGCSFSASAIQTLQRVNYLYRDCGINFAGIRIILGLMEEMEKLRDRLRRY